MEEKPGVGSTGGKSGEPSLSEQRFSEKGIGRNEPCPCGSGKKYKRCHGVGAAPKVTPPRMAAGPAEGGQLPFDPSKMDPAVMAQASQAIQRLPKSQLQRLQSIMQRAMAGKDVTREAAELEQSLPPDFRAMMTGMMGSLLGSGAIPPETAADPVGTAAEMTTDEARKIVEEAVRSGRVSAEEAKVLLEDTASSGPESPGLTSNDKENESGISKLWRSMRGRK